MKKILFLFFLITSNFNSKAQVAVNIDSLFKSIRQLRDDTSKVNRLNEFARTLQRTDIAKADELLNYSRGIAKKINYPYGQSYSLLLNAGSFANQKKLDSCQLMIDSGLALVKDQKGVAYQKQMGMIAHLYGSIYQYKNLYDSATAKYLEAARMLTMVQDYSRLFNTYGNLSIMYVYLKDTVKMEYYARLAYRTAQRSGDSLTLGRSILPLINVFTELNMTDSLLFYTRQGLAIALRRGETFSIAKFYQAYGRFFMDSDQELDSAIYYYTKAQPYLEKLNDWFNVAIGWHDLGEIHLQQKKYDIAAAYFRKAIGIEKKLKANQILVYSLDKLALTEAALGMYDSAYHHLKEFTAVNDTMQIEMRTKDANELETKYRTELKDKQLKIQESSIKQKNTLNYILVGSTATLLIISLLAYRTYQQKRKLQEQKIADLEKEKLLLATQSILKGQEEERSRLAKDLHDGLGGLLSGVKLQLGAMKGNLILSEEHGRTFNNALGKLDESISEMRRVAHNMMPEALMKLGLQQALHDYCDGLSESQPFKINCEFYSLEKRMPSSTEIAVYRIVQELLNNAVKHSGATTILAQVIRQGDNLSITVEDNGNGFDINQSAFVKGAGLRNIQTRVDYLKGRMDLKSTPGKGTSVHIECAVGE